MCHSVFSCFTPAWSFQVRDVASEKLATFPPPAVERTSGSFPRFPINMTLFRLRDIGIVSSEDGGAGDSTRVAPVGTTVQWDDSEPYPNLLQ